MKIFLAKRAAENYSSIRKFITEEWGEKVSEAFEKKTNNFLDLLELFPELGSLEFPEKKIRGFQLTK